MDLWAAPVFEGMATTIEERVDRAREHDESVILLADLITGFKGEYVRVAGGNCFEALSDLEGICRGVEEHDGVSYLAVENDILPLSSVSYVAVKMSQ